MHKRQWEAENIGYVLFFGSTICYTMLGRSPYVIQ